MEPDYKSMYLHMVKATDMAIRALIEAQQFCEDFYLAPQGHTEIPHDSQPDPYDIELS